MGDHFCSSVNGIVPCVALLTEICYLANIILFAHFLGQFDCYQAGGLPHLHHIWL